MIKRKLKKLFNNPGIFFRDFFLKKYPVLNLENRISEVDEHKFIQVIKYYDILEDYINIKNNVDIVYTWVDKDDVSWKKKFNKNNTTSNIEKSGIFANDDARFSNNNELYYSLLSVKKFLPWVNNIYIITDAQVPAWFSQENYSNVFIIDHKDIIPIEYLPTFNSHVIEAFLHKIPNLSENFIYFNDDVFVARELKKEHFFHKNGLASIFVSGKSLSSMYSKGVNTPTLDASFNCQRILNKNFSIDIDQPLVHTYVPLKKSCFDIAWTIAEKEVSEFLTNKFRSSNDMNLATFFVPWLMYIRKDSVPKYDICYYFNIRSVHAITQYEKLLDAKNNNFSPHSFCANDFSALNTHVPDFRDRLQRFLTDYYN